MRGYCIPGDREQKSKSKDFVAPFSYSNCCQVKAEKEREAVLKCRLSNSDHKPLVNVDINNVVPESSSLGESRTDYFNKWRQRVVEPQFKLEYRTFRISPARLSIFSKLDGYYFKSQGARSTACEDLHGIGLRFSSVDVLDIFLGSSCCSGCRRRPTTLYSTTCYIYDVSDLTIFCDERFMLQEASKL